MLEHNRCSSLFERSYVLFWMSMAQAHRIIDDSNVQIPNVRAWRPFTEEERNENHGIHDENETGEHKDETIRKSNEETLY